MLETSKVCYSKLFSGTKSDTNSSLSACLKLVKW